MAETVSDPTDWNDTKLPFISSLDAALRCEVCKEFYTAPMITTCCHTFCSLCIRKALHNDGKCPLCRSPGQECHLRKNTTVQDLLDAFVGCREKLFEFAMKEAAPIPRVEDENTPSNSQPSVRPRRSRRRAVSSESNDDDPQPVEPAPPPDDGLVSCPVCTQRVKMDTINAHVDKCLQHPPAAPPAPTPASGPNGRQLRSTRAAGPSGPPMEPLPKLTYSFLKDNKLRQKLRELGISDSGSRKLLEERHTEWITIWNANLDSPQPKSKSELLVALNTWERAHTRQANNKTKSPDWSDDNWAAQHKDNFSSLIEQARANVKRQKVENGETSQDQDSLRKETASAPPPVPSPSLAEPVVAPSSQPAPVTRTRSESIQSRLPFSSQPAPTLLQDGMPPSSQPAPAQEARSDPNPQPAPMEWNTRSDRFPPGPPPPPNNVDAWRVPFGPGSVSLPPIGPQYEGAQSLPPMQSAGVMPPQYPTNLPPFSSLHPPSSQQGPGLRIVQWQPKTQPPRPPPQPPQIPQPPQVPQPQLPSSSAALPTTSDKRKYDSIE